MRQFAPLLLVPVALALVAIGYDEYSMTEDVFGDVYRPHGSLGLALMVTGLVIGYWSGLALARPSWGNGLVTRARSAFQRPGRLIIVGLFLGGFGIGLVSVTDAAGDTVMYHPFDVLGLEVMIVGVGLAIAGVWRLFARPQRGSGGRV
jgi:hypothetical protein